MENSKLETRNSKQITAISVVMPALNEEAAIVQAVSSTVDAFEKLSLHGEVVVVNDGSTDKTPELVKGLVQKYPGMVFLVSHDKPMGVGKSFRDGVAVSHNECVTMLPGDNENDPEEILRYTFLMSEVDVVNPFVVNKEVRARGRNTLSTIFTFIINLTFGTSFKYTNGTIIYRKKVLDDITNRSGGFFAQAETLVKAWKKGYLIAEVPYFLSQRRGGQSKAVSFSSFKKVMAGYFYLIKDIYFTRTISATARCPRQS